MGRQDLLLPRNQLICRYSFELLYWEDNDPQEKHGWTLDNMCFVARRLFLYFREHIWIQQSKPKQEFASGN